MGREAGAGVGAGVRAGAWARGRRLAALQVAFLACGATLTGCGGGGGAAPLPPAPPPPPPQVIPAVLSVPEPVGYDADHLAAFHRLNELRAQAGLGLFTQSVALDSMAQAHTNWEVANSVISHVETEGTPEFFGATLNDRFNLVGYLSNFGTETLAWGPNAIEDVNVLVNLFYHREAMLSPELVDVGIGYSSAWVNGGHPAAFDLAVPALDPIRKLGQGMRAATEPLVIWPVDGSEGVYTQMGNEIPNPVPNVAVTLLGTPITVNADYWKSIKVDSFVLKTAAGELVDCVLLTADSDPNALVFSNFAGLVPLSKLERSTTYDVKFSGSVDGEPIVRIWHFTTASADRY
jgi:hypothetical protein